MDVSEELSKYPSFYPFRLGGLSRFSLVSKGPTHRGSVFGLLEGSHLWLFGDRNFDNNGGHAWGMNYEQHVRVQCSPEDVERIVAAMKGEVR